MFKQLQLRAIGLALFITTLTTSCKENITELSPQATEEAEEATLKGCTITLQSQMNTTACPNGKSCGCEAIAGLAARKKAYWDQGHAVASDANVKEFLGMAMLETLGMNPYSYPYGDEYKKKPKVGYAANGGAIKQNVFVLSVALPGFSDTYTANVDPKTSKPTTCPTGKTCWNTIVDVLNKNESWDVDKFEVSKAYFAALFGNNPKAWYRVHRGGASYLTKEFIGAANTKVTILNNTALRIVTADKNTLTDNEWNPNRERRGIPLNSSDKGLGALDDTDFYIRATNFCRNNLFFSTKGDYNSTNINNFPNMLNNWRFWADVVNI